MSKLPEQDRFIDLSDYGRPIAVLIAKALKPTFFTPVHVTLLFGICGLLAIYCMLEKQYAWAGCLLVLKSILDAADGELSRVKQTPSYTGRFLDSIFDFLLNIGFLLTICAISGTAFYYGIIAFLCIVLQGTLYNYYYVIRRNQSAGGDKTSRIFEYRFPKAFPGENQRVVNVLFVIYTFFYGLFDRTLYLIDRSAVLGRKLPAWFMTGISVYGLGFQLLIMAIMLNVGMTGEIIGFLIGFTLLAPVFVILRKALFSDRA